MDGFASMFREYDIRGRLCPEELNEGSMAKIAAAFAQFLRRRHVDKVVLGYDNRQCSPAFCRVAAKSLLAAGLDVYDIGLTLSPVAYFAQYHLEVKGVMMITASHNPENWSGLKLGSDYSSTLEREEVLEIYRLCQEENFPAPGRQGSYKAVNLREAYLDNIVKRLHIGDKQAPKIVVDAGNGAAGLFAWELFQRLGCRVFALNCDPDNTYPHYFPNPSDIKAGLRLGEMVTHPYIKADFGLSFDGDGDRLGVMDAKGNSLWADGILTLFAADLLRRHKNAHIIFDVKCGKALLDTIEKYGGRAVMCKTGHSFVKSKMRALKAPLAGERSGHIFWGGEYYYGFDDALFAGAKLVEIISQSRRSLTEMLDDFPRYYTSSEIKVPCPDERKHGLMQEITASFKAAYGAAVNDMDGARVTFPSGWGLVRASNNLPELVLIFEGKTKEAMQEIFLLFQTKLRQYPELGEVWENVIL